MNFNIFRRKQVKLWDIILIGTLLHFGLIIGILYLLGIRIEIL